MKNKRPVPLDIEWAESGFDPVVIELAKSTPYIRRVLGQDTIEREQQGVSASVREVVSLCQ